MTTKNLVILAGAAALLGAGAWLTSSGSRVRAPALNGKRVTADFNVADVACVEIAGKLKISAGEKGWSLDTKYSYPASVDKIRENVLKLHDLKVGQVARGRKMGESVKVEIKDAAGKALAAVELGDKRFAKPRGQMAMFAGGGYPDARYLKFEGECVLVKDPLTAFDGDFGQWVDTRICEVPSADVIGVSFTTGGKTLNLTKKDSAWTLAGLDTKEELDTSKTYSLDSALSYLNFTDVADPKLSEAELGFATGSVYTVSLKNGRVYKAEIGNIAKGGGDRYFRVSSSFKSVGTNAVENAAIEKDVADFNAGVSKWTYLIASYSAEQMIKSRKDIVKAKEEPKKDESAKGTAKK